MRDMLRQYNNEEILHDYMMMAEDYDQDDTDVAAYRAELKRRGYAFITEEPEYDPEELAEELHPMLLDSKVLNKFQELSYKKQSDILRAVGLLPTNAPSTLIQNMFQDGSQAIISPIVMSALGEHITQNLEDTDIEIIED